MTKLLAEERKLKAPALPGSLVTPTTLIGQILRTPRTPIKSPKDPSPVLGPAVKEEIEEQTVDVLLLPEMIDLGEEEVSIRKARRVKELLYETIYPRWMESIEIRTREGSWSRKWGLERFEPGM